MVRFGVNAMPSTRGLCREWCKIEDLFSDDLNSVTIVASLRKFILHTLINLYDPIRRNSHSAIHLLGGIYGHNLTIL